MPQLELRGCRTRPLLSYLKALGALRAISRQVDAAARGRWSALGYFELSSALDEEELTEWFSTGYVPPTILSPWNGGSGFYPKGNTTAAAALGALETSADPRLDSHRTAIAITRRILASLEIESKPTDEGKLVLIKALRAAWPDDGIEWLDASTVEGSKTVARLPILGAGGGDGRFDFSSNYMQALPAVLGIRDAESSERLLRASVLGDNAALLKASFGHLDREDSPVKSAAPGAGAVGNPWDLVLGLEGSLIFAASATRRHESGRQPQAVAPFTARSTSAGFASASGSESGSEVWMPVWHSAARLSEVSALSREARAQVGRQNAVTAFDFARASADMGVARGIDSFERFSILERSGQSNLAVAAGRIPVSSRPGARALGQVSTWLSQLERRLGDPPASVREALRALRTTTFAMAQTGRSDSAEEVLVAMGRLESALVRSGVADRAGLAPPTRLDAASWIEVLDRRSPEVAVAVSLASLRGSSAELPTIRDYLHGTQRTRTGVEYPAGVTPRKVPGAGGWDSLLAQLHARRFVDAARSPGSDRPTGHAPAEGEQQGAVDQPLGYTAGVWCDLEAARAFAGARLDGERIVGLVGGLSLLGGFNKVTMPQPSLSRSPNPSYDLLALAFAGTSTVPLNPRGDWPSRLATGDIESILRDAHLRLRLADINPLPAPDDLLMAKPMPHAMASALLLRLSSTSRDRIRALIEIADSDQEQSPAHDAPETSHQGGDQ